MPFDILRRYSCISAIGFLVLLAIGLPPSVAAANNAAIECLGTATWNIHLRSQKIKPGDTFPVFHFLEFREGPEPQVVEYLQRDGSGTAETYPSPSRPTALGGTRTNEVPVITSHEIRYCSVIHDGSTPTTYCVRISRSSGRFDYLVSSGSHKADGQCTPIVRRAERKF